MLRRILVITQWGAIVTLIMGVALVQLDEASSAATGKSNETVQSTTNGLLVLVAACGCSGFAGVYSEKILKAAGSQTSLWERNVQMCFLGLVLSGGRLAYNDFEFIVTHGVFYGYRPVGWAAIGLSAFGGLLPAVVVKYADNVLKAFATSIVVVLSVIMSVFRVGQDTNGPVRHGAILVNGSVYAYGKNPAWHGDHHVKPTLLVEGEEDANEFKHIA